MGQRLFNLGAYKAHLQKVIELLYEKRKNTKDPREMACFDEQVSLVEKLQRNYDIITDFELGEITKEEMNKKIEVI